MAVRWCIYPGDGRELWRGGSFSSGVGGLAVNSADGSCWIAANNSSIQGDENGQVIHLAQEGTELSRTGGFYTPAGISVNPIDGSCWVGDGGTSDPSTGAPTGNGQVVHLQADGTVLWTGTDFGAVWTVSVNPTDGSCWVADAGGLEAATGTTLPSRLVHLGLVVSPVADFSGTPTSGPAPLIVHFTDASTNSPTSWSWDFGDGGASTAQNPSHTYAKGGNHTVALTATNAGGSNACTKTGYIQASSFSDVPTSDWAWAQIQACVKAGIVQGYSNGTYAPTGVVNRGQMAVFISRALAHGDSNVPTPPATAHFSDVPTDYWAYKYISYAYANNIVQGYFDGSYKPEANVARDQMAVFIARSIVTPLGEAGLANYTPPATATFSDVATNYWAFKYVEYCHAHSVVNGYSDGTYKPGSVVTRDQMAVFVTRAFKLQ